MGFSVKKFKVATRADLDEIVAMIGSADIISYDIETTGLNPRKDKVIGFAICGKIGEAWYLPLYSWDHSAQELVKQDEEFFLDVLFLLRGKRLIMHNGSFDCRFTYHQLGVDLSLDLYADTMLMKHTVDEERPFGLKDIAKKIQKELGLDITKEANQEQLELSEHLKSVGASQTKECYELYKGFTEIIGKYACADVDLTLRVFNYYSKKLKEEGLENFFYLEEVMPLYREVTIPMELNGVPIDTATCSSYQNELAKDLQDLEQKILQHIEPHLSLFNKWFLNKEYPPSRSGGFAQAAAEYFNAPLPKTKGGNYSIAEKNIEALPECRFKSWIKGEIRLEENEILDIQKNLHDHKPMFNIYSKDHLKRLFFTALKMQPNSRTEKGNPQVNDEFLEKAAKTLPWVEDLLLYNRLMKLKTSYYDRFMNAQEDGMFYPSFQQHRTISGRYGSDIQQLPRPADEKKEHPLIIKYQNQIRKLFIAGDYYAFIDADYESLEPHVFAHVSGDERLRDIFRRGHDFYSTIAIRTEKIDQFSADKKAGNYLGDMDHARRQKAKAYSLGIPYGMTPYKLKFEIGCSEIEAKKLHKAYLDGFPDLATWMQASEKQCLTQGWVRSEAGRVRHMPEAVEIYKKHGSCILDDLELWKEYNERPTTYRAAKEDRKKLKNYLNNSKNFQIQSLSTSIVNRSALALTRYMRDNDIDGYVCAQIHDQLIVRVRSKWAEDLKIKMQEIMENTYPLSIKLKAPANIASNWFDGH